MKYLLIMFSLVLAACSKQQEAKSIDYYVAHHEEAQQVLKDCESRVKTASDYPKIMAEENCANANLATERWNKAYNNQAGKQPLKHKVIF